MKNVQVVLKRLNVKLYSRTISITSPRKTEIIIQQFIIHLSVNKFSQIEIFSLLNILINNFSISHIYWNLD